MCVCAYVCVCYIPKSLDASEECSDENSLGWLSRVYLGDRSVIESSPLWIMSDKNMLLTICTPHSRAISYFFPSGLQRGERESKRGREREKIF